MENTNLSTLLKQGIEDRILMNLNFYLPDDNSPLKLISLDVKKKNYKLTPVKNKSQDKQKFYFKPENLFIKPISQKEYQLFQQTT